MASAEVVRPLPESALLLRECQQHQAVGPAPAGELLLQPTDH